mgnify:CR=1 FL=1
MVAEKRKTGRPLGGRPVNSSLEILILVPHFRPIIDRLLLRQLTKRDFAVGIFIHHVPLIETMAQNSGLVRLDIVHQRPALLIGNGAPIGRLQRNPRTLQRNQF